jgi:FtsZ-binding cell division protein ZapB
MKSKEKIIETIDTLEKLSPEKLGQALTVINTLHMVQEAQELKKRPNKARDEVKNGRFGKH